MIDNEQMQVILASLLLLMTFVGAAFAGVYVKALTYFFAELAKKEPDVWKKIGRPTLANMLFLPFWNFRKYYAFLGVLKERRHSDKYKHANQAYILLINGLIYCLALFLVVVIQCIAIWG